MSADFENNIAFQTAYALVLKSTEQPNGYTELPPHASRRESQATCLTLLNINTVKLLSLEF